MDFAYSDEQRSLRETIVRFARKELNRDVRRRDRDHEFDRESWRRCGEMGLAGLPVPEEHGGQGLDALSTAIALEALGYGCEDGGLVFGLSAHLLACVVPVWKHGSEEQKRFLLPRLARGEAIAVNGMTEPETGSDAFAMRTRAVAVDGGFRLRGTKTFATNGPIADVALVYAVTDPEKGYHGGVTAFLVDTDAEGFRVGQTFEKMGLRTCPIGELVLEDVFVPATRVLGKVGGGAAIFAESMDWERACLVACHLGTMERLVERAVAHARSRVQFGKPIGKYQAISHRIADMKLRLEASRLLTYRAAWRLDRGKDAGLHASMAKVFASEALVRSALDAVQILGGYGFMVDEGVERILRDAVGGTIYSGTSEMQRNIVARWMGL